MFSDSNAQTSDRNEHLLFYPTVPLTCLAYHPSSELKGFELILIFLQIKYIKDLSGYYPNISQSQLIAVNELKSLLLDSNIDINYDEEHEFLKLLR